MKLYLAGPISGLSYQEVVDRYAKLEQDLNAFQLLSPMTGKGYLRNQIELKAHGYGNPVSTNHAIFERDTWMVARCDVMLALLKNSQHVSIGTCMELAIAAHLGKHTVTVMEKDNVHQHSFVLEASDIVFNTYDEAIAYLNELIK